MTKYREIIRLAQPSLHLNQEKIAASCGVSKKTVNKVLAATRDKTLAWPLSVSYTDAVIERTLFLLKMAGMYLLQNGFLTLSITVKNCSVSANGTCKKNTLSE